MKEKQKYLYFFTKSKLNLETNVLSKKIVYLFALLNVLLYLCILCVLFKTEISINRLI